MKAAYAYHLENCKAALFAGLLAAVRSDSAKRSPGDQQQSSEIEKS